MSDTSAPVLSHAASNRKLIGAFERYLVAKNYSASTQVNYPRVVQALADFIRSSDIRRVDLRTMRGFLAQRCRTAHIYRGFRLALRRFYRFLILAHEISWSPVHLISNPKTARPLPRCLTENEAESLISAAGSPRDRAILELLYASGLRASELVTLDLRDLNLERGTLMVRGGKGNKDGLGMLGSKATEALLVYLGSRKRGPVFINSNGNRLRGDLVRMIVRDTARRAGLEGVHTHTMRHTFATVLLNRGADIRYVQELMRHDRISTTAIYLHTAIADLARVYEKCHPHAGRGGTDVKD